jgi:hypothetical protein
MLVELSLHISCVFHLQTHSCTPADQGISLKDVKCLLLLFRKGIVLLDVVLAHIEYEQLRLFSHVIEVVCEEGSHFIDDSGHEGLFACYLMETLGVYLSL